MSCLPGHAAKTSTRRLRTASTNSLPRRSLSRQRIPNNIHPRRRHPSRIQRIRAALRFRTGGRRTCTKGPRTTSTPPRGARSGTGRRRPRRSATAGRSASTRPPSGVTTSTGQPGSLLGIDRSDAEFIRNRSTATISVRTLINLISSHFHLDLLVRRANCTEQARFDISEVS